MSGQDIMMVRGRFLWEMGSCQAQDAGDGQCNAFKFNNNTGSCDMAQVGLTRVCHVWSQSCYSWPTWRTRVWARPPSRWCSVTPPQTASRCTAGAVTGEHCSPGGIMQNNVTTLSTAAAAQSGGGCVMRARVTVTQTTSVLVIWSVEIIIVL